MVNLCTGGWGYIATNLLKLIPDSVIYDLPYLDILDYDVLESFIGAGEVETVYHLAAIPGVANCEDDKWAAFRVNVEGTFNTAKLCKEYKKKLVFASSQAADKPVNFYGVTKVMGEQMVLHFGGSICRISNVYGGEGYLEKKDSVVARLQKGTFEERGFDYTKRDYIHVDEVCRYLMEASQQPNGLYRIRTGIETNLKDLKELAKRDDFPDCLNKPGKLELLYLI